jgi:hypothetical protein
MRVADSIEILDEIKIDFIIDQYGNPTEETYEYKEVVVKDVNGVILEIFRVSIEVDTNEKFFDQTGVKIGISSWV